MIRNREARKMSKAVVISLLMVALATNGALAENPQDVVVVNTPTVDAQQKGPWKVEILGQVAPSSPEPFQGSSSLAISTSEDTWTWTLSVPSGKRLTIEYVSGAFKKQIGGDQAQPPFRFTVNTTASGSNVSHVLAVTGVADYATSTSWFQVTQPVRLYADGGTTVTVKLEHLFSKGYTYEGFMSLSGQLVPVP